MRSIACLLGLALVFGFTAGLSAADKEVKLKGTVTCAKCDLKKDGVTKCATVINVKDDDKEVLYWFDDASHGEHHSKVCTAAKKGAVTGTVEEKDGKKWVKVTKLELDE